MIVWGRNINYKQKVDMDYLEHLSEVNSSPYTTLIIDYINFIVNILLSMLSIILFKYNIFLLGLSFVVTDIILCNISNLILNTIPYKKYKNMTLEQNVKQYEKVLSRYEGLKKKLSDFRKRNCNDSSCRRYYYYEHKENCLSCEISKAYYNEIKFIKEYMDTEKEYIDNELEKVKKTEIKSNNKKSKDFDSKIEYFKTVKEKLELFRNDNDMDFLISVLDSITLLIDTLDKKPIGIELVPNTLCLYLDELQSILEKLLTLESDKRETYIKDIDKISKLLSGDISSLISRINNFEVEDIEVGINVLLQELTKESEDNKNV